MRLTIAITSARSWATVRVPNRRGDRTASDGAMHPSEDYGNHACKAYSETYPQGGPFVFYRALRVVLSFLAKVLFCRPSKGWRTRAKGAVILASNHLAVNDIPDPMIVHRKVNFLAKEEYFEASPSAGTWWTRSARLGQSRCSAARPAPASPPSTPPAILEHKRVSRSTRKYQVPGRWYNRASRGGQLALIRRAGGPTRWP